MSDNTQSWDRIAAAYRADEKWPSDVVHYGHAVPDESELRLLGDLEGKRVLDLGCGTGESAVALARAGAYVTGVDASSTLLNHAHALADRIEVRVEWHHGDASDLAFLRADSIDNALSVGLLNEIDDLDRLLRQVHRVLRPSGAFVCAYTHPIAVSLGLEGEGGSPAGATPVLRRPYGGGTPIVVERFGASFVLHPRSIADMFSAFTRAGFHVEVLLEEPSGNTAESVPSTIIWRARKVGV
jgi:SAM-dependent methyltransferase